jgi:hypothetical protein
MDIPSPNLLVQVDLVKYIRLQKMAAYMRLRFSEKITYFKNTSKAGKTTVFSEKLI